MSDGRVLVVEDDRDQREALEACLVAAGFEVRAAPSCAGARAALAASPPDAVITDHHLPDGTGLELIETCRALPAPPAILLVTAYGTVPLAVEAIRRGAVDLQVKPIDPDVLVTALRRALRTRALETENRELQELLAQRPAPMGVVAESRAMKDVLERARRVAPTKANVLVTGESGVGKEIVAEIIHREGRRPDGPFVALNCAALPEGILESELFGHARGAFTGAVRDHRGVFEQADGGTLFLDEIGEIPPSVQAKLLRVLEERKVVRLGEGKERTLDFRLVAATNKDLAREARAGRFREDLRYRLEVVRLHVPPLRERPEDVVPLARHFAASAARENDLKPAPFSEDALAALVAYPFPGNVRQLRNVVESALIVAAGRTIEPADLALEASAPGSPAAVTGRDLPHALEAFERAWIVKALAEARGGVPGAAVLLGIPERTLRYKLTKFRIEPSAFRRGSGND